MLDKLFYMNEKPLIAILDREKVRLEVKEHFQDQINLIQELINYGTNLLTRCFASSNHSIADIAILAGLVKQFIAMLDACEILLSNGAVLATRLPSRSLFECYLNLIWILEEKTEERANQYYVWHLRQRMKLNKKIIKGNPEYEDFKKNTEKYGSVFMGIHENNENSAIEQVKEIVQILNLEDFIEINNQFEELEKKKRNKVVSWFEPSGPHSIRDLATRLNLKGEYDLIYSPYSEITHGVALYEHIEIDKELLVFEPIRSLKDFDSEIMFLVSFTLNVYRKIILLYRPDEINIFKEKYVKEWRDSFRNIPKVVYRNSDQVD